MGSIDFFPFLAAAVAHNPRALQRLNRIVGERRGALIAEGERSTRAKHRVIMMGRAEHIAAAHLVLGYLTLNDVEGFMKCLGAGWREAMKEAEKPEPSFYRAGQSAAGRHKDDLSVMLELVVFRTACVLMGKTGISPKLEKQDNDALACLSDWMLAVEQADRNGAEYLLNGKRAPTLSRQFFHCGSIEKLNAIQLSADLAQAFDVAQEISGIDAEAYTDGVTLSAKELEAVAVSVKDADAAKAAAYAAMLLKAANADKAFALAQVGDAPRARAEAAEQKARELTSALAEAHQDISRLKAELSAAKERDKRREDEKASQAADLSELASLRSALYLADQQDEDDGVTIEKATREIPKGLVFLGGLPQWRAEMAQRIPDAKLIPADVTLPEDMIRAASELWIEPSYLGHSSYYRAVAVAKAAGVPIRYFPGRNAERCVQAIKNES